MLTHKQFRVLSVVMLFTSFMVYAYLALHAPEHVGQFVCGMCALFTLTGGIVASSNRLLLWCDNHALLNGPHPRR